MKKFLTLPTYKGIFQPLVIILVISLLITASTLFYLLGKTQSSQVYEEYLNTSESIEESTLPDSASLNGAKYDDYEITNISTTWNLYKNNYLGFSIEVPKQAYYGHGGCEYKSDDDHSYRPKEGIIPVTVITDNDTVYIGNEYYYKLTGETNETNDGMTRSFFSGCEKTLSSPESSDDMYNQFWSIKISNIADDKDLTSYIQEHYGSGCNLGSKTETSTPGVYNVSIKGDGKDLDETKCPINYMYVLKYDENNGKLANWNRGQACYFSGPGYATCYDQEMTDSFTFLY